MRLWAFLLLLAAAVMVSGTVVWYALPTRPPLPTLWFLEARRAGYEKRARERFYRKWPGERPLNWRIAAKAEEFHRTRPMGKFVLHSNDCSDFVDAIVDDALGAQARFRRGSRQHVLMRQKGLWEVFYWRQDQPLIPGDVICVEHSPHYRPHKGAIRHIGVVGTDGQVYDWSKIKSWDSDRYGRHSVQWFTRYSGSPKGVAVWRLRAEHRYRVKPLPVPHEALGVGRAAS